MIVQYVCVCVFACMGTLVLAVGKSRTNHPSMGFLHLEINQRVFVHNILHHI